MPDLNLNHPIRFRNNAGFKVTYITTKPSREHSGKEMIFILVTDPTDGTSHIAYRLPDGRHSHSGYERYDLVNIDTNEVATMYQATISSEMAKAIKTLWLANDKAEAVALMTKRNSYLHSDDVRHYFEGLFG